MLSARLGGRSLGVPDRLSQLAATTFRGLLVVAVPLDLLGQSLFFTELLESAEHLVDALVGSGLYLDRGHTISFLDKYTRTRNLAQIGNPGRVLTISHRPGQDNERQIPYSCDFCPPGSPWIAENRTRSAVRWETPHGLASAMLPPAWNGLRNEAAVRLARLFLENRILSRSRGLQPTRGFAQTKVCGSLVDFRLSPVCCVRSV